MQMAVITRNVLGYADANSTEMNEDTKHPVNLMEEQKNVTDKGGQCV
jgi:CTP synthase